MDRIPRISLADTADSSGKEYPKYWYYACLLLAMAALPFAITTRSLWLDEGMTTFFALTPSFDELKDRVFSTIMSEGLMPLSILLHWSWAKLLGSSEYALRLPNLLYAAISLASFCWIGLRLRMPWLTLFFAIQPFLWYYLDEARPYILQIMCGSIIVLGIVGVIYGKVEKERLFSIVVLALGYLILCYATLLGVIFTCVSFSLLAVHVYLRTFKMQRVYWFILGALLLALLPVGLYYLEALTRSSSAKVWAVTPANALFSMWEVLGFQGFGPSRENLRALVKASQWSEVVATSAIAVVLMVAYIPLLVGIFRLAMQRPLTKGVLLLYTLLTYCAGVTVLLFLLAVVAKFPFWGRHFSALLPAITLILAMGLQQCATWSRLRPAYRIALIFGLPICLLYSSLTIRYSSSHLKQDYRRAAAIAQASLAKGERLWWAANIESGEYYGLRFPDKDAPEKYLLVPPTSTGVAELLEYGPPDTIIMSRKDIHDPLLSASAYITEHKMVLTETMPGFSVYRKLPAE